MQPCASATCRWLGGCGGVAQFVMRSVCGGVARGGACAVDFLRRSACGGVSCGGPVVLSVVRSLRCRTTSVLDVFPSAHQFRT